MTKQREALELARDMLSGEWTTDGGDWCRYCDQKMDRRHKCDKTIALDAIDAALAAPDPQPVAWRLIGNDEGHAGYTLLKNIKPIKYNSKWWRLEPLYAAPVATAREISEQQLIDMFQQYLEDHRDDGRQISPRTGKPGYDECEWQAFEYAARAVLAAAKEK